MPRYRRYGSGPFVMRPKHTGRIVSTSFTPEIIICRDFEKSGCRRIWICRWIRWKEDGDPAELMVPAFATPIVTLGLLNCGVLVTLKTSPRICTCSGVSPFERYTLRNSEKS